MGFWIYATHYSYILIPDYQKSESINYSDVCAKIQDSKLKIFCFLKINDNNYKLDLREINSECGESGVCYYKIWGGIRGERYISRYLSDPEAKIKPHYCGIEEARDEYCSALLENPHYCKRMYLPKWFVKFPFKPVEQSVWLSTTPEQCYHDAALFWKDPLLCENVKNKDFCYLSIVVFNINTQRE